MSRRNAFDLIWAAGPVALLALFWYMPNPVLSNATQDGKSVIYRETPNEFDMSMAPKRAELANILKKTKAELYKEILSLSSMRKDFSIEEDKEVFASKDAEIADLKKKITEASAHLKKRSAERESMQNKLNKRYTSWESEQVNNLYHCLWKGVCGSYEPPLHLQTFSRSFFEERERDIEFANTIVSGHTIDAERRHKKEIVAALADFVERYSYLVNRVYSRLDAEALHFRMLTEGYSEEECATFSKKSMVKTLVKIQMQYATTSSMWRDEPTCEWEGCGEENTISHC